jgi:hypothetical protein
MERGQYAKSDPNDRRTKTLREYGSWGEVVFGSFSTDPTSLACRAMSASPPESGARNVVERFFNKIKQCWLVATRHDKLAANYLAFIQLASI